MLEFLKRAHLGIAVWTKIGNGQLQGEQICADLGMDPIPRISDTLSRNKIPKIVEYVCE